MCIRDRNENVACWKAALMSDGPAAFVCSRQKLDVLKPKADFGDASRGGYLVKKREGATITLLASGSEVMLALRSGCDLEKDGILANVVSLPCMEIFNDQDEIYRSQVIDPSTKTVAIEAASGVEWYRYAQMVIGMESFGASGEASSLFKKFGFTQEAICAKVRTIL